MARIAKIILEYDGSDTVAGYTVKPYDTVAKAITDTNGDPTGISINYSALPGHINNNGYSGGDRHGYTQAAIQETGAYTLSGNPFNLDITGSLTGEVITSIKVWGCSGVTGADRKTDFTFDGTTLTHDAQQYGLAAPVEFTGSYDTFPLSITVAKEASSTFGYAAIIELEISAAGITIDSSPASISPTESFSFTVSGPATVPTTGNTTGNFTGLTGVAPDSVTGSDPYTITWTLPRTTARLFDATGYVFDITIGAESVSSSAIPYAPPTGSDYITVGTIDTGAQVYTDYTGGTFVSTDQLVWDNSPSLSFTDDLNYVVTSTLSATVYRIAAAGTVDAENTITFSLSDDGIVSAVIKPIISNVISSVVN